MLIGIDASRANQDHKSGTEWYSYYLIRELARLDSKNQYVLYTNKPLTGGLADLTASISDDESGMIVPRPADRSGYQEIKSPHNNFKGKILKWPFSYFWTQGRMSWEMLWRKPDILFVPAHAIPFILPRKTVNTVHDVGFGRDRRVYSREIIDKYQPSTRNLINFLVRIFTGGKYGANSIDYLHWSTKFTLRHSQQIITVSNFSRQEILDIYGSKYQDKIKVVYNGYNNKLYRRIDDRSRIESIVKSYGIEMPYLLYVGRLERKKNTPALIEAYAIVKERNRSIRHKLVLVGDASYGYDEVKYIIKEYGVDDEVIKTGWIKESDMPYIFNGASAFIFPSLYEGFGIPILQAMSCGLPVAASNTSSIPEITADAAVLFNPHNIISMAEGIESVITDEGLRNSLIAKGYQRADEFSWEKTAEHTLRILENL